jgi:hypothetical protein
MTPLRAIERGKTVHTQMHSDGDTIRIETPVPVTERMLGLPFLVGALYVGYNFVYAAIQIQTAEDTSGWGMTLFRLGLFLLAFGVLGSALVFGRRQIVLERNKGRIREVRKLAFYGQTIASIPLDKLHLVRAALRYTSSPLAAIIEREKQAVYEVELINADGFKESLAGQFSSREEAIRFSRDLAFELALPFEDHTASEPVFKDAG